MLPHETESSPDCRGQRQLLGPKINCKRDEGGMILVYRSVLNLSGFEAATLAVARPQSRTHDRFPHGTVDVPPHLDSCGKISQ